LIGFSVEQLAKNKIERNAVKMILTIIRLFSDDDWVRFWFTQLPAAGVQKYTNYVENLPQFLTNFMPQNCHRVSTWPSRG
jgi:hypothetical protein